MYALLLTNLTVYIRSHVSTKKSHGKLFNYNRNQLSVYERGAPLHLCKFLPFSLFLCCRQQAVLSRYLVWITGHINSVEACGPTHWDATCGDYAADPARCWGMTDSWNCAPFIPESLLQCCFSILAMVNSTINHAWWINAIQVARRCAVTGSSGSCWTAIVNNGSINQTCAWSLVVGFTGVVTRSSPSPSTHGT